MGSERNRGGRVEVRISLLRYLCVIQYVKNVDIEILKKVVPTVNNFSDLSLKFGYTPSTRTRSFLKKIILDNFLDISHFDTYAKIKAKRKHPLIKKECPVCKIEFNTLSSGDKREKTYCSRKCCNSLELGNRHSKETNNKTSNTLKLKHSFINKTIVKKTIDCSRKKKCIDDLTKIKLVKPIKYITCKQCGISFKLKNRQNQIFCTQSCASKALWNKESYRNKIISNIKEKVKNGTHKGWTTRNILSYPERFFIKVLDSNGFKGKYKVNFPVTKKSLGIECSACYFLDFYFEDIKFNLEVDGKQHKMEERIKSDMFRDETLKNNGIQVYRIEWKNITKNKEYIRNEIKKLLDILNNLTHP